MTLGKRCAAEFIGTFWLVFGGCGSAVLASVMGAKLEGTPVNIGISLLGVSLAFGLTVLTMAYAIGHISGCHLNPAVSVGLVAGGRFPQKELVPYIIAQVLGGLAGAAVLYVVASGKEGFTLADGFAANGYADHSPGKYSLIACLAAEIVLTFMFLMIILSATDKRPPQGLRTAGNRPGSYSDPLDRHTRHKSVGEPGAVDRPRGFRRRLGHCTVVAVLGRADRGRGNRGDRVSECLRIE